jgi:hypothetical protein
MAFKTIEQLMQEKLAAQEARNEKDKSGKESK